ncbi:hypothetical protein Tco_1415766 [Tanacetum coccineum]
MTKSEGVVVLVGCGGGDVVIKWLWWWHSVEVGLSAGGGEPAVVKMTKVVGWSVEDGDEEMMVVALMVACSGFYNRGSGGGVGGGGRNLAGI